ncbi:MAG: SDR family NAD(P)-dependent oxidoreductase [Betaproteobacteria bacterium]|nr:SDR family NAD(P)-dependent oxidoreductase [Betaproteobacteria bacterium]
MTDSRTLSAAAPAGTDLLRDRVVLVTGAGRGLGRAVALACAAQGATVALLGRQPKALTGTYDAIVAAGGSEPAAIPLDLATAGDHEFEMLAGMLRRDLGQLDALVHCAVHFTPLAPLRDQPLEQWMTHLRVNLAAPFALTRACLPMLAHSADGAVIFTAETHAFQPAAYWGAFAVSKSGLGTLAAIWADECEQAGKPRFHVVVPGPIGSPQRAQSHPGENRAALPTPEAAANAYLRLLGPEGKSFGSAPVTIVI